ncbi:UDP-N-acetylmuramoyl-tripeptide--D-alanyl-D-alanine ligase [Blattabacterium cuenoti]|uniref:UDP-N-acetylmuramoyl-tripeptide--D-alanyl-D- alanine ligase n=1 Tax=Blattabacterium cuenoti TaxID=1653831 RepID=UPI00163BA1F9|nr:UDP-N-acetylmuramoyl-tripeptide--D-alanyl-D-alanine ligase [Blattabacterium cuenoti]
MDIQKIYQLYIDSSGVEINSKNVKKGSIFIALKGKNFNGNQFTEEAISNGALLVIVDDKKIFSYNKKYKKIVQVDNTLFFLQKLALFHRHKLRHIPIIAITGSNGKTTTKELTKSVLSKKYKKIHFTKNNFNNHIGIPLTILSMSADTKISVIEIGANHEKEIEKMCSIINPDYGYITNFGKAHLEGFKSIEGIIRGKLELYDFLKKEKKIVFVNGDDPIQLSKSIGMKRYIFSEKMESDLNVKYLWKENYLYIENMKISSSLIGSYNLYNMASAISIGKYFEVPLEEIRDAIREYIPINHRSQVLNKQKRKIIIDCYNANPTSMIKTLTFFDSIKGNKIAILGDMLELGLYSNREHENIIFFIEKSSINKTFLIGEIFSNTHFKTSKKIKKFVNKNGFIKWIKKNSLNYKEIDYVLIKGSRKIALETIIDLI